MHPYSCESCVRAKNRVVFSSLSLVSAEILMTKACLGLGSIFTQKYSMSCEIMSNSSERF